MATIFGIPFTALCQYTIYLIGGTDIVWLVHTVLTDRSYTGIAEQIPTLENKNLRDHINHLV